MPERTVSVGLIANTANYLAGMRAARGATNDLGKTAQTTGEQTRAFVSKVGGSISKLGGQIGGEFGGVLSTIGSGIDEVASKTGKLSTALQVGGGVAIAAGAGLEQFASSEVQASAQLKAAVENTGHSWDAYSEQVEKVIKQQENYDHSAVDTQTALRTLTNSTQSPQKALQLMGVTADIAAAQHTTLAAASKVVSRVLGGQGGRTLALYGIQMDHVGTKTQQGQRALTELGQKLDGQATASVSNFGSQLDIVRTKITDFAEEAAGPAGIALTAAGVAANITGVALSLLARRATTAAAAQTAVSAGAADSVAPLEAEATAATATSASLGGLEAASAGATASIAAFATGPAGIAIIAAGALYAVSSINTLTDAAVQNEIKFKDAAGAAKAYSKQLSDVQNVAPGFAGNAKDARGAALQLTAGINGAFGQAFTSAGLGGLNTQYQSAAASITKIDTSMAGLVKTGNAKEAAAEFSKWQTAAKETGTSLSDLNKQFPTYTAAVAKYGDKVGDAGTKTDVLDGKFGDAARNATFLQSSVAELTKSMSTYGQTAQTAESATENYYSSLDAANKSIKDNKKATDDSTAAGRANNQALYGVATAANAVAEANLKNKKPLADVEAGLDSARTKFISIAEAMGYNATQARNLADQLIQKPFKYTFNDNGIKIATNDLRSYLTELAKIPNAVTLPKYIKSGAPGQNRGFASGGLIAGAASSRDNLLLPMASGEFVTNAAAASIPANRAALEYINAGNNISGWSSKSTPTTYTAAPVSHSTTTKHLEQHITFVNPVQTDVRKSADEAGQVLSSMAVVL